MCFLIKVDIKYYYLINSIFFFIRFNIVNLNLYIILYLAYNSCANKFLLNYLLKKRKKNKHIYMLLLVF